KHGVDLWTVIEKTGGLTRRGSRPPKYRNPSNPNQTWTGSGQPAKWMRPLLEKAKRVWDPNEPGYDREKIIAWLEKSGFAIGDEPQGKGKILSTTQVTRRAE